MKKVACFITSGFTEYGAMTFFLRKINPHCQYIQCFPNKPKRRNGQKSELNSKYNGYTGQSLLDEMYRRLQMNIGCKKPERYDVILIEDDLDGRFHHLSENEITQYQQNICDRIVQIGYKNVPIIFLFASPEIEAWFLSDWENSFKESYRSILKNNNDYFCNRLKKYIDEEILKEYTNSIELFGFDENDKYTKLSTEIESAISTGIKEAIKNEPSANQELKEFILNNKDLYYSKRLHGDCMLRNISPGTIAKKCTAYFQSACRKLKEFQ